MTTDQLTPEQKTATSWVPGFFDSRGWGFGVAVLTRRDELGSIGRYGWDGGMGTDLFGDFWTSVYQAIDD
jgi:CubicO group peptidase (beta-lactamase class C family)